MTQSRFNRSAPLAVAAAIAALVSQPTLAQAHPEKPTYKYEKCYGIAKTGLNDCFFAGNSCAGTATSDNEPGAWIYVPHGTCRKIVGGSLEPPASKP